ncbi:hypothetical protein [Psychrobacter sp. I-STPA6b]|uniref:hypothetical protein n=1 Tax=Psychrobacter sp. I-STPA6b TaxID=2585718 RepID=UPI001D0CD7AD|nr:hypothetical protein [Psychrobacter sp. I-STPA6b]
MKPKKLRKMQKAIVANKARRNSDIERITKAQEKVWLNRRTLFYPRFIVVSN